MLTLLLMGIAIASSGSEIEVGTKQGNYLAHLLGESNENDNWPMFHHDLNRTGYSVSIAPRTNRTEWIFEENSSYEWKSPVVVDGIVYTGGYFHTLPAINATTGTLLWSFDYPGSWEDLRSAPAVDGDQIFSVRRGHNM
jgi:outer membrane protein assembly factor BamB